MDLHCDNCGYPLCEDDIESESDLCLSCQRETEHDHDFRDED